MASEAFSGGLAVDEGLDALIFFFMLLIIRHGLGFAQVGPVLLVLEYLWVEHYAVGVLSFLVDQVLSHFYFTVDLSQMLINQENILFN